MRTIIVNFYGTGYRINDWNHCSRFLSLEIGGGVSCLLHNRRHHFPTLHAFLESMYGKARSVEFYNYDIVERLDGAEIDRDPEGPIQRLAACRVSRSDGSAVDRPYLRFRPGYRYLSG